MKKLLASLLLAILSAPAFPIEPVKLFQEHCAACHGPDRLGITGPALLPESLTRLRKPAAIQTVTEGRAATQMLPFAEKLSKDEIKAIVDWVYTPVVPAPQWTESQLRDSRIVHFVDLPDRPAANFKGADMMNLFLVVETGDHHVTVLDGDKLEPIHRFPSRYALHGGPKFTPDGRYVFFASRDGWVSKFDIWNLKVVAEVRAGINTRNVAVSGDGKYVAVANYLPHSLVILDADLNLKKILPVSDKDFYFCMPYETLDLVMYAALNGVPADRTAEVLGMKVEQVERAWKDFERKKAATKTLRMLPPAPTLVFKR